MKQKLKRTFSGELKPNSFYEGLSKLLLENGVRNVVDKRGIRGQASGLELKVRITSPFLHKLLSEEERESTMYATITHQPYGASGKKAYEILVVLVQYLPDKESYKKTQDRYSI